MSGRTLIAGIGNIFLSDDGFGVEVSHRLMAADLPPGVQVVDYGIRGLHLAYDLAGGFDTAILIDTVARGGAPGTVYVIEPDLSRSEAAPAEAAEGAEAAAAPLLDAHGMQPDVVLQMLDTLGGPPGGTILIVGCEPATVDYGMGLSEPVTAAVDEAIAVVLGLVAPPGAPAAPAAGAAQPAGATQAAGTAAAQGRAGER